MSFPWSTESKEASFLRSALCLDNRFQPLDDVVDWLRDRQRSGDYRVREIPLEQLDQWTADTSTGNITHRSGRFFSIEGLAVHTNFPGTPGQWHQPIINQPEIGILGIVSHVFDGVRYFLMHAKMEPGNVNLVQLSPTLQATKSNFTQVHRGRQPRHLERFVDTHRRTLVDQLQSEQGTRFLKKRNRNMIVDVADPIAADDDFRWLTLAELKRLLVHHSDLVNMDARTVLSCIPFVDEHLAEELGDAATEQVLATPGLGESLGAFGADLVVSMLARKRCLTSFDEIISWFTHLKTIYELHVELIPLNHVEHWHRKDGRIEHVEGRFFAVVGVDVEADDREVGRWSQPILRHDGLGLVGFVTQKFDGVLHFLVHGKVEPGILDIVEMGPTVSIFDIERRRAEAHRIPFLDRFLDPPAERVRYSQIQSEEGGRFWNLRNHYLVVEVPPDEQIELPENFAWMTLGQMLGFIRYNNYFNIEARGLLAALSLIDEAVTP